MTLKFNELSKSATMPTKEHATDSGFDLYASENVVVHPNSTVVVGTDVSVTLPKGYEAVIRPRSGITSNTKLRVQLGTIDNEYNGELGIIVDNIHPMTNERLHELTLVNGDREYHSNQSSRPKGTYLIKKGDKIAQLVLQPLVEVKSNAVIKDEQGTRGGKGFGDSGTSAKEVTINGKAVGKTTEPNPKKAPSKKKTTPKKKETTTKKKEE